MAEPTLKDTIALQRKLGITEHLLYLGQYRFHLAHTDEERASIDLPTCELHGWLADAAGPGDGGLPAETGFYRVTRRVHDGVSESFRSDASPWIFDALNPCRVCGWAQTCEDCHS